MRTLVTSLTIFGYSHGVFLFMKWHEQTKSDWIINFSVVYLICGFVGLSYLFFHSVRGDYYSFSKSLCNFRAELIMIKLDKIITYCSSQERKEKAEQLKEQLSKKTRLYYYLPYLYRLDTISIGGHQIACDKYYKNECVAAINEAKTFIQDLKTSIAKSCDTHAKEYKNIFDRELLASTN